AKGLEAPGVADLGTGSGNLAIAAARHHPSARVTATDVSPDALELASRNAQRHGVADRIQFVRSDLLAELPEDAVFHFILSNPPYVASEDIERLPTGVRDFEPRIALDGGPGGTAVVERLIRQASRHLAPSGYLILEIGAPQEQAVRELIAAREFEPTQTARDYSGHPRVVWARKRAR
ncbi:MAG: peptide chain release factor N(5)-glutamine methyltransferase, partial [Planctomycetes bacterium]|nr:peptide chain release factor N(5)-glutamine methyltransferase [Planctomycetota bacterium]